MEVMKRHLTIEDLKMIIILYRDKIIVIVLDITIRKEVLVIAGAYEHCVAAQWSLYL